MKNNSLFKAILINLIFLVLAIIFCDMKYEVSDDFVMQSIIEGAYGNSYDSHLLYSNILLGYGLKCLYLLFPKVGWYFVMHITLCFLGLTAVSYVVLDSCENCSRTIRLLGLLAVIIFVSFFSDDVYILVQFTKTAAVACLSGALLVVYEYNKQCSCRRKIVGIICGIILCLMGAMVRRATVNIALMFLAIVFVRDVIAGFREAGGMTRKVLHKLLIEIILAMSIYACTVGLAKLNSYIWNSDEVYGDYQHWNALRSSITDISGADDEIVRQRLLAAGYTLEDTYMIQSWEFVDQNYYNEDVIRDIAEIKRDACENAVFSPKVVLKTMEDRGYYRYTIFWGFALMAVLAILISRRILGYVLAIFAVIGFQIIYCICHLKIVYRVEYCFFYCASAALAYIIAMRLHNMSNDEIMIDSAKLGKIIYVGIFALLVTKIPLYVPDKSYEVMTDEEYEKYVEDVLYESWVFDVRKYKIDVSHRNPYGNLIELMENDSEHYYLCDFSSTIQLLYYGYKPWKAMPIGYYKDAYSYIGGVTSYFPGCYLVWNENEIDYINPYKSIANENIRLVDNYYYLTKVRYYNEKYNPQAELSLVDKLDGMQVWEIR